MLWAAYDTATGWISKYSYLKDRLFCVHWNQTIIYLSLHLLYISHFQPWCTLAKTPSKWSVLRSPSGLQRQPINLKIDRVYINQYYKFQVLCILKDVFLRHFIFSHVQNTVQKLGKHQFIYHECQINMVHLTGPQQDLWVICWWAFSFQIPLNPAFKRILYYILKTYLRIKFKFLSKLSIQNVDVWMAKLFTKTWTPLPDTQVLNPKIWVCSKYTGISVRGLNPG